MAGSADPVIEFRPVVAVLLPASTKDRSVATAELAAVSNSEKFAKVSHFDKTARDTSGFKRPLADSRYSMSNKSLLVVAA